MSYLNCKTLTVGVWCQLVCVFACATDYYVDSDGGDDGNTGTATDQAWASLAKASAGAYVAGDRILLQRGDTFAGKLLLLGMTGADGNPIEIASYGDGDKPFINAAGYLAGVHIRNSHYVDVRDLEISADGGATVDGSPANERYGVLVDATTGNSVGHVNVRDVEIHDVYPEIDTDHEGKNPTTYLGTGIRISGIEATDSSHFLVEGCDIRRMGFKAIEMRRIREVDILDNYMQHIGGPAMQPSRVDDLVVRGNTVDGSGDFSDPRMHGRGSGIWPWTCDRVLIEKNRFMHARGRADSCGAHIDFNCNDVVVQYNLSWDNEGGFVEILGNNNNCAYRYNISIDDGARVSGENGANGHGNTLWTSGFVGSGNTLNGPFNSYIYNNTIYVSKGQRAGFRMENTTGGLLVANNIFFLDGPTASHTSAAWTQDALDRTVWENNLYQRVDLLPSGIPVGDSAPLVGDPGFAVEGGIEPENYEAFFFENVKDKGIVIEKIPGDAIGLRIGLEVAEDFFGNPIVGAPDLGAVETGDVRPPLPDTASFDSAPAEIDSGRAQMEGVRVFEPVEYFFAEVSGNAGGSDSGWQADRFYEDTELLPNTAYRYQVSMRDRDDQELLDSPPAEARTAPADPFVDRELLAEDFSQTSILGNQDSPFPANAWHLDNATGWQRDNSGSSVAIESTGGSPLRLGWGFDEVEIRYFLEQPIDLSRSYRFSGSWEIKSLLENSLGFIAGIGEFDSGTGAMVMRIKETVFGETNQPAEGMAGAFEVEVSTEELGMAGVNPSNYIGVFFHHDDNGVLFQEAGDNEGRNDVYLVDDLLLERLALDSDSDNDGMSDSFENTYGFAANDPNDAEGDADGDGLSNRIEFLWGTLPDEKSILFLPPVSVGLNGTRIAIPAEDLLEGRIYILERSADLGQADPWRVVDAHSTVSSDAGSGYAFERPGDDGVGFFRVRVEWAR